ncbi:MAG: CBM35 domain-containing protein [Burkholderiaceae bacterium]
MSAPATAEVLADAATVYLADGAQFSGNVVLEQDHPNYLGQGFASNFWTVGDGITFSVSATAAGDYDVALRYLNGRAGNQTLSVYVNGARVKQTALPPLGNWSTWGEQAERVTLRAGANTIGYRVAAGDTGQVNLNSISVSAAGSGGTTPPPSGTWTQCAVEWQVCSFSGTAQVRYGANGTYVTKTATGSIGCNNEVFGDPLPGADKVCEYMSDTTTPPPSTGWIQCAVEWQVCSFTGTAQVRYGASGVYVTKTATGSIGCNNQVFGDPLPGADKVCEYSTTDTGTPPPDTPVPPVSGPTTMSCVEGSGTLCSGDTILRIDNGVALTRSGVQVYGKSTSDLKNPNPDETTATGLMLASGGTAEVRINIDSSGNVTSPVLLLSNLGLTWDGKVERPKIIETFRTTQGRVQQDASGAITSGALPDSSNLSFYDFATKGVAGTQVNYANNSYFPRSEPSRCDVTPCRTTETTGPEYQAGNWQSGGFTPNQLHVFRLHEDGDIHAGNGQPDADGNPTWLEGGNGIGVPFPGSKGGRDFYNQSFRYGSLATWETQDTVQIGNWGALNEHNKKRRGTVAFGAVTDPAAVPASGSASYSGVAYGWYAPNASDEPAYFRATATVTVNFATRAATVSVQGARRVFAPAGDVPVSFSTSTAMGAVGSNVANYLTGTVGGTLSGGVGGRYFGPVAGGGPAEVGGSFKLSNAGSGAAVVGGFIARKQ